jgi:glutathione S-transferase
MPRPRIRVYRVPYSTNVERVALAAAHKGLVVDWVDVPNEDRSAVVAVSGQELVPVLVDGDRVVHDSPAILRVLEERWPEPALWPAEPAERAEADVFVEWFDAVWKGPPNRIAAGAPEPGDAARLAGWNLLFEALLAEREFLLGAFGIADVVAFPFLKYALVGPSPDDADPFHAVLAGHLAAGPAVAAWIRRMDERPRA